MLGRAAWFPAAHVFTCIHLYAPVFTIEKQNRWCVEGMEKTHRAVMLSQGTGAAQNSLLEARDPKASGGLRRPPEAPGGPGGLRRPRVASGGPCGGAEGTGRPPEAPGGACGPGRPHLKPPGALRGILRPHGGLQRPRGAPRSPREPPLVSVYLGLAVTCRHTPVLPVRFKHNIHVLGTPLLPSQCDSPV